MKFLLNSMLVMDLGTGTAQRMPLPEDVQKAEDTRLLAALFPNDVVIAAGRLSGSYAPSSSVLTLYADGKMAIVKGQTAPALRRCGLDAIVLKGYASSPCGVVVDEKNAGLVPADSAAEVPAQHAALVREARRLRGTYADSQSVCIVTGPAAFLGSTASALAVEPGLAPPLGRAGPEPCLPQGGRHLPERRPPLPVPHSAGRSGPRHCQGGTPYGFFPCRSHQGCQAGLRGQGSLCRGPLRGLLRLYGSLRLLDEG